MNKILLIILAVVILIACVSIIVNITMFQYKNNQFYKTRKEVSGQSKLKRQKKQLFELYHDQDKSKRTKKKYFATCNKLKLINKIDNGLNANNSPIILDTILINDIENTSDINTLFYILALINQIYYKTNYISVN